MYMFTYIHIDTYHTYMYICIYLYCMRFANPVEATGGSVGQNLGALRICKGCLGVLRGPWKRPWGSLGVQGGSLGSLETPSRVLGGPQGVLEWSLEGPLGSLGSPWGTLWVSGSSLEVLGGSEGSFLEVPSAPRTSKKC